MKTVFQLIEENGLTLHGDIEHFAALVIANHPPQSYMTWQEGYEAGKQAEREACAKVCEQGEFMTFGCVAEAIRARGQA